MRRELERLQQVETDVSKQIEQATRGRPDTAERQGMLVLLAELKGELAERNAELAKFKDLDPDVFEERSMHITWCISVLLIV